MSPKSQIHWSTELVKHQSAHPIDILHLFRCIIYFHGDVYWIITSYQMCVKPRDEEASLLVMSPVTGLSTSSHLSRLPSEQGRKTVHCLLHGLFWNLITKCLLELSRKPFDETNSLTTKYCLIWRYSPEALQSPAKPSSFFRQIKHHFNPPGKLLCYQQGLVRGSVAILATSYQFLSTFHLSCYRVFLSENPTGIISR